MSENELIIEQASSADIPAMVGLLAALFSIEQDFKPDTERQIRGLAGVLASPNACIMLARSAQGEAIAMCSAQLVFSTAEGAHSAWIEDMVVHEAS